MKKQEIYQEFAKENELCKGKLLAMYELSGAEKAILEERLSGISSQKIAKNFMFRPGELAKWDKIILSKLEGFQELSKKLQTPIKADELISRYVIAGISKELEKVGVYTVQELWNMPIRELIKIKAFGKTEITELFIIMYRSVE